MYRFFSQLEVGEAKFAIKAPEDAESKGATSTGIATDSQSKGNEDARNEVVDVDQLTKRIAEI